MAYNQKIVYRYNSYITKKIPYIRISIKTKRRKLEKIVADYYFSKRLFYFIDKEELV